MNGFLRGATGLRFGVIDRKSDYRGRSRFPKERLFSIETTAAHLTHYLKGCQPYRDSAAHQFDTRVEG